jgi:DNA-binding Xre family transcriptional regulator
MRFCAAVGQVLAAHSGIARGTLEVMGSQATYNATIRTLEEICVALEVAFGDLLEIVPDPAMPKRKRTPKKK